jgi:DNA repair protein RecN (Recombination protein N)
VREWKEIQTLSWPLRGPDARTKRVLSSLYIRDYALIEELEVDFSTGLNIITGETGAGKSIIVGAMKLILGERAASDAVRSGARKAIVEGVFDVSGLEAVEDLLKKGDFLSLTRLILRREVSDGHSRAFVNDTPATVQQLRTIASELVDLHGQHEHQSLLKTAGHSAIVDDFGRLGSLLASYVAAHEQVRVLVEKREEMLKSRDEFAGRRELLSFQIDEIDALDPQPLEEEQILSERRILENAEDLFTSTASLFELIYESDSSLHDQLVLVRNAFQDLIRIDPGFESHATEIQSALLAVEETARYLQDYNSKIEFNPERLEFIRERLIALDRLKMRYGGTIESVLEHRTLIGRQYGIASNFEGTLEKISNEILDAQESLSEIAQRLTAKRKETARRIETAVVEELSVLGIPEAKFRVNFERTPDADGWIVDSDTGDRYSAFKSGADRINFELSTNIGEDPMPLAHVASGGEISRVMLALKSVFARTDRLPIMIFDEIDSGISGSIARKVGERLHELAQFHQIIAITHLAQVASLADSHFKVEKSVDDGRSRTSMRRLNEVDRHREIASLLSGDSLTEASLHSAKELIGSRPEESG